MGQVAPDHLPLVDAEVGALLRALTLTTQATRVLEIGTAFGHSGIWMAGVLPAGGMFITMEADESRAKIARDNFTQAGLAGRVSVIVGDAQRMLHKIAGPFDLIFQDGDKTQYGPMLETLVDLLRPGGLLVSSHTGVTAAYHRQIHAHPSLMTSDIPLRDGMAISIKR